MKRTRIAALIAAALVAGLALGTVATGFAATPAVNRAVVTAGDAPASTGLGLRLGASMRTAGGRLIDVVAKLTGLSTADVAAKRAAGQSFEQIAAANDVSADKVVSQALAVRKQLLAEKVKAGAITQAQADAALANMKTRLDRESPTRRRAPVRGPVRAAAVAVAAGWAPPMAAAPAPAVGRVRRHG